MNKIYPVSPLPKSNFYYYFTETCSECGGLHPYRKYGGWNEREHVPMCYEKLRQKNRQMTIFDNL